ncbi:hypothetical protein KFK14_19710 [Sphingobium phenoxybenzoativorans]|uniref:Uncharacterized protein n=1 Tax=Sphingobium phenoxybenzoativorans TaxID=1592790 RepID=A0A975Q0X0_9SPHN|nr:hypothetical protein [Sphingobium phenoxybenzoativorans]QUT05199.1 hypothetical protein KFK14_19710 [Sphingobium phenoxybenzoativorans]
MEEKSQAEANDLAAVNERNALTAKLALSPLMRNATITRDFANPLVGDRDSEITDTVGALAAIATSVGSGDLAQVSATLTAQALSLDAIFTQLAHRSAENLGKYPEAAERYMRLAFKAQSSSRATLEALIRLHSPREQVVKHVHVNEGGQAVIADNVHNHPPGNFEKNGEQSHAAATESLGGCAALPSPDPLGNGVPIPSREGETQMQDAWRDEPRRTKG